MSFSNFMRRMFGGEIQEVTEEFDDLDSPEYQPATIGTSAPEAQAQTQGESTSANLADVLLAVINAQFPPAIARCIDHEAQRRWLAEQIGPAMEAYEASVANEVLSRLTGDKAKIQAELEELRAERKEVTSKREEQKAALLSEQRQRRALADRNRDLENKINELDSEIEQHKLTISSLMNKIRVAEVSEGDAQAYAEQTAELAELRRKLAGAEDVIAKADTILADKDREIAELTEKIAELQSAAALQQAIAERQKAEGITAADDQAVPKKRRQRSRKQKGAELPIDGIDSSADLEEIDWLLPGGTPAGHVGHVSDPEFGYQPPKQTPAPESDAQLTLF